MVGSMYAAISGLRAHQQKMNVIGNNIANVNTYGYKTQRTTFSESMYSSVRNSTGGTATTGGVNAAQIGYGCTVGTIDMNMRTGNYAVTDNPLDIMLDGDGMLMVGPIKQEIGHMDKNSPIIYCLQETHFKSNDIGRLRKEWEKKIRESFTKK